MTRYLKLHDELLKVIMLLVHISGGQGGRITELLTIEHTNTASRLRSIYFYAGRMFFLTHHHKARLRTHNEFQVARFLPEPVAFVIYNYLVFIRPLTYMLLRACFRKESDHQALLFRPASNPGTWKTAVFSSTLLHFCKISPGIPTGLDAQLYRQVSIAITERHVRAASQRFNRYDEVAACSKLDAVFAWQSGHRPRQRYITYGLDGAYPHQLQPALLQLYVHASEQWHAFLRLSGDVRPDTAERRHQPHGDFRTPINAGEREARKRPLVNAPLSSPQPSLQRPAKRRRGGLPSPSPTPREDNRLGDSSSSSAHGGSMAAAAAAATTPATGAQATEDGEPLSPSNTARANGLLDEEAGCWDRYGPFVHLPDLRVFICCECRFAVVTNEVMTHLRLERHRCVLTPSQRRDIYSNMQQVPDVIQDQAELARFQYPPPTIQPIPFIWAPAEDGMRCKQCPRVYRQPGHMRQHLRKVHGWKSDWKKGGDVVRKAREQRDVQWTTGVRCQRLFPSRAASSWFEVGSGN